MMSVGVTNRNGPAAAPPTSLNLRSSHNQLLSSDVTKQGSATPPKCRKKYALTSIQAAMGLGETPPPGSSPPSPGSPGSSPSPTANNPKLAKNDVNQLRKAGQDHNRNTVGGPEPGAPDGTEGRPDEDTPAPESDAPSQVNGNAGDGGDGGGGGGGLIIPDGEPQRDANAGPEEPNRNTEPADPDENTGGNVPPAPERNSNLSALEFHLSIQAEDSDDISILSEKELMMSKLLLSGKESFPAPPPPSPPRRASPEDTPLLSVASSSSASSSPETKKERRTGAKTDCALNRIQNLNPSDEEASWTTLSQESNTPEETDIWSEPSFQTDPDLPPGWKKITDMAGVYYWHIPTGTTQWERPCAAAGAPAPGGPADPQDGVLTPGDIAPAPLTHSSSSASPSPTPDYQSSQTEIFFGASPRSGSTTSDSSLEPLPAHQPTVMPSCGFVNSCYFPRSASMQGVSDQEGSPQLQEEKTELVQKFQVFYLGMLPVARPIGMDILNGAIDSLVGSCDRADWNSVALTVADATVTISKDEEEEEVLVECRVRFLSFMGVGHNVHSFAFIMDAGGQRYDCHVFWCEPNAGGVSEAVQAACMLRVKRGVLSLIDTLKQKRPVTELPQ
ncbi:unnamed protein product [Boreogadus saida]